MRLSKKIVVKNKYLNFPVKNGVGKSLVTYKCDGEIVGQFDIELSDGSIDMWAFSDVNRFNSKEIEIIIDEYNGSMSIDDLIIESDDIMDKEDIYKEKLRPNFHFTTKRGWLNDPNGLVYYDGEYHLFYQHNPYSINHGNMHWGHAISRDLVNWAEMEIGLYPDEMGTMFSGCGVVDWKNTTGFQTGEEPPLVLMYTAAGGRYDWSKDKKFTQCLAYSNDKGRSWTKYIKNPVLDHIIDGNRDPKVIWNNEMGKWLMSLYFDEYDFGLFTSNDMKSWERICDISMLTERECPDIFELAVDNNENTKKWVISGANGKYIYGHFDGENFIQESEVLDSTYGDNSYAAQTWSDIDEQDSRRIQISWGTGELNGMPFNKIMTFPTTLTLRTTPEGIRLYKYPVKEISKLIKDKKSFKNEIIEDDVVLYTKSTNASYDINACINVESAKMVTFNICDEKVIYNVSEAKLCYKDICIDMKIYDNVLQIRMLVDKTSIEVFGNDGLVYISNATSIKDSTEISVKVNGKATIKYIEINTLKNIWE